MRKAFFLIRFLLILPLLLIGCVISAQPGNPGGGGKPGVPITGIEVLIGLGGALGLKKMMSKRKNNL
ncbi:MAG: hypothetical protein IM631_18440 [Cytophagales bacterium]|nr:hypothetical protein [Cytophagales bacterium]